MPGYFALGAGDAPRNVHLSEELTMKTSILVCFGAAALFACSSDNNNTDGPVSADAPAGHDGPSGADAGAAKTFTFTLTKTGEPACAGAGASATGSATVTISADGNQISAMATYSGLSGAANHAHIHFGGAAEEAAGTGKIVLDFGSSLASPINKTFTATDYQAASGAPATFAAFVAAARQGGMAYINIHTAACGGGEIGGVLQ